MRLLWRKGDGADVNSISHGSDMPRATTALSDLDQSETML